MTIINNKIAIYITISLLIGTLAGIFVTQTSTRNNLQRTNSQENFQNWDRQPPNSQANKDICLADDCLLVNNLEFPVSKLTPEAKKSLDQALDDEYKALTTYQAVIAKFGSIRPFSMIKGAEEQHIASLKAIYDKYGIEVPLNNWNSKTISVPATIQQACQLGVDAEIANAALYSETLLPTVANYEDITAVFTNLMNASEQKHLPAFEKCN